MLSKDEFYCIGDEVEVKNFLRILEIDNTEILNIYLELSVENKYIVQRVLRELTGNTDFFGFNFNRLLMAYRQAQPRVSQLKISRTISEHITYIINNEKIRADATLDEFGINKNLDAVKKTTMLNEIGTKGLLVQYIKAICDYLLIDINLLKCGIGKIYVIKDEWFDTFMDDSAFGALANKDISNSWSTRLYIQKYEDFLRKQGKLSNEDSILDEKWAVMTYSGAYLMLKKNKKTANEIKAVECLIMELYELQRKYNLQDQ